MTLTWTFLDAEHSVRVFGIGIVLQLETRGVVDEGLGTLRHTSAAVIKVGTGLENKFVIAQYSQTLL